jgi:hypothetical protein
MGPPSSLRRHRHLDAIRAKRRHTPLRTGVFAPLFKKTAKQLPGFGFADAGNDFDLVIQSWICGDVVKRARGSGLWIRAGVHKTMDPRMDHCPSAHKAGFQRAVESASGKPVISLSSGRLPKSVDLGVGGHVIRCYRRIVSTANDSSLEDDYRTDRNFTLLLGISGKSDRDVHEADIISLIV